MHAFKVGVALVLVSSFYYYQPFGPFTDYLGINAMQFSCVINVCEVHPNGEGGIRDVDIHIDVLTDRCPGLEMKSGNLTEFGDEYFEAREYGDIKVVEKRRRNLERYKSVFNSKSDDDALQKRRRVNAPHAPEIVPQKATTRSHSFNLHRRFSRRRCPSPPSMAKKKKPKSHSPGCSPTGSANSSSLRSSAQPAPASVDLTANKVSSSEVLPLPDNSSLPVSEPKQDQQASDPPRSEPPILDSEPEMVESPLKHPLAIECGDTQALSCHEKSPSAMADENNNTVTGQEQMVTLTPPVPETNPPQNEAKLQSTNFDYY
ncbi:hypothetical protein DY000_02054750 [Brassica cretica]|uniref:Uncharacterized protein n=1 Tax=Brassica cretica TaxID=69181 RepID=A0ABQ7A8R6_BRACR|nr:hypothetical protein DY000_02054750 [Brassica cretica]